MQCEQVSEGLTIREFARLNNIAEVTARRIVNNGTIPSYMVGGSRRIPASVLAELQRGDDRGDRDDDLGAEIQRLVDLAPKLTAAQRDTIAAIFAQPISGGAS